jgi:hypothetical protein
MLRKFGRDYPDHELVIVLCVACGQCQVRMFRIQPVYAVEMHRIVLLDPAFASS